MSSDDTEMQTDSDPNPRPESDPAADEIDAPEQTNNDEADLAPRRRACVLVGWVILLVLVLLLGGGAYYWQQNVYQTDLRMMGEQLVAATGAQARATRQLENTIAELRITSESAAKAVNALGPQIDSTVSAQSDLQRSVSALYEKETQTSVDWVLAEAEYLVLAATQRLALERDVDTALAALQAADQRLRSADHPGLIPIRDQLIQDIIALESVNLPDVEGFALYLAKTIAQVDELPSKPVAEEIAPFVTVREGEFEAKDWRRLGYAMWSDLVDLVEVKDAEMSDTVLFDPELRYFLQQNLKLELASARLAVLRRDRANLEASVGLINRLLEAYYDTAQASVASISKRLNEAAALDLAPRLPSITGSLEVIRQHRQARSASIGSTP
jgi:uroporphyrin-3 C-methyltransferase